MEFWSSRSLGSSDTPDVATYKAIRAAGRTWFTKIIAQPFTKRFEIIDAAKKVGLPVADGTILFDDESEMPVLMDYYLFDYRPKEKSVAESSAFAPQELTPLEAELHQANFASRTSLFVVTRVHPTEPKIFLQDRLDRNVPELWLTDVALSDTFRNFGTQVFLYTRVVSLRGVHLTGGFSFVFDLKHESVLIDGYHRAMWSVPESLRDRRRTRFFLALNRKFGQPQAYTDIPPSPESQET